MSDASNFVEEGIINYFLRPNASAPTRPTTVYLALFSDTGPAEDGTGGTEITTVGSAYARSLVHNNTGSTAKFTAPAQVADAAESPTNADITFSANTLGISYTVQSVALVTTASGAFTLLAKKILSAPVEIQPGQSARILAGGMIARVA